MTSLETPTKENESGRTPTPEPSGAGDTRRSLLPVLLLAGAVGIALVVHVVTAPVGAPPTPIAARVEEPPAREPARPAPPPPRPEPVGPFLREDPKGPLLTASGKELRRLAPARRGRKVALIFDDGPGPYTASVVRELRAMRARATFFLVGREVVRRPEQVRALRDARMELGNHSFSHRILAGLREPDQRREVELGARAIAEAAGVRPQLFRPPHVGWDVATARALAVERQLGVLHTVETGDWASPSRGAIAQAAGAARPGDVVALHDGGGDRTETVAAVKPIVAGLRRRGLEPVTVSQLAGYPDQSVPVAERARGARGEVTVRPR
jgi:peptidoglycan-N-acetylglucosamine deacetylase